MKKFFVYIAILVACFVIILNLNNSKVLSVSTNQTQDIYARVNSNNCLFYNSAQETNPTFLLQETYFVKLLEDTNAEYYKARYMDLVGYVKKENVEIVNETPSSSYLDNITFNINSQNNCYLRSSANSQNSSNIIKTLPAGTANLQYIGKLTGNEAENNLGNIWYYCKYTNTQNQTIYGYVYSPLTVNLTSISPNFEQTSLNTNVVFKNINSRLTITPNLTLGLIAVVTLPSLFILYLLFKPSNAKLKK